MKSNKELLKKIKEMSRSLGCADYMTLEHILDTCDFVSCKLAFCDILMAISALEEKINSANGIEETALSLLYRIAIQVFRRLVDLGSDEELSDADLGRMIAYFITGLSGRAWEDTQDKDINE